MIINRSHSNIYNEFFKNLPASFSPKSHYQVAVLFSTLQTEAKQSTANLKSVCRMSHIITRELFTISNPDIGYKQKLEIIQFVLDLVWSLSVTDKSSSEYSSDLIVESLGNLTQIIEDLGLFNKVDDQNNQNVFKNWSKKFITETFDTCRFNGLYAKFLIRLLHIDHVILDSDLELILKNLKVEF